MSRHHHRHCSSSSSSSSDSECTSSSSSSCEHICCAPSSFELNKLVAVQYATSLVGKFALKFSAAARETDPVQQALLVRSLQRTLTKHFLIEFVINGNVISTATDYATLMALIQSESAGSVFDAIMVGNITVRKYTEKKNCRRTISLDALQYDVQTQPIIAGVQQSILIPALDQFTIVEPKCNEFRIKKLVVTFITLLPIPLGQTVF